MVIMIGLLVLSCVAASSAQLIYLGYGLGYAGYPYAVPNIIKPVVKEVEVPVPVVQYAAHDTGCTNSFGNAVPCLQEGEARRKREADEEPAAEAEAAAPVVAAAPVL